MRRRILLASLITSVGVVGTSCSAADIGPGDENIGTVEEGAMKCLGGTPGDSNFCANPDPGCQCDSGEGDCDFDSQCTAAAGLVCVRTIGLQFGYTRAIDVCAPAHCDNNIQDTGLGETQIDCGGPCGTVCGNPCADNPPAPESGHCSTDCPCNAFDADCDTNDECMPGLVCDQNHGDAYGFSAGTDVCAGAHCFNGTRDADETGTDCGGAECRACTASEFGTNRYGGTGNDRGLSVAFDPSGNIIVAGRFSGTANFGGANLTSAGFADVFVAKYDSTGGHLWSKRFGGANADGDNGVTVATDGSGNVVVAGNYYLTVNFGGSDLTAVDSTDMFVVKLDSAGNHVWSKSFGGTGIDRANGVDTDVGGNVIVAGSFQNSINFGGGALNSAMAGTFDIAVARLTAAAGGHLMSRRYGSTGNDVANDVAVDSSKNILVAGAFEGTVNFGLGDVVSAGQGDGYLLKTSSAGTTLWVKALGGTQDDLAHAVTVDASRRPIVAGDFKGSADFGGGVVASAGSTDVFVVAFDEAGTFRWTDAYGGTLADHAISITANTTGDAAVIGNFSGSVNFGGGALASAGSSDIFIVRNTAAGAFVSSAKFGGGGADGGEGVAFRSGVLAATGWFEGTVNFGTGGLVSAGQADVFVARFGF
jgi:hypothetical protein